MVTRSLNQFPSENGISNVLSPLAIVTGKEMVDFNKIKGAFGDYVQVHETADITNTMAPRSVGGILLNMTPNDSGYYEFMNLNTGKLLTRRRFTVLPITQQVVERVEQIAKDQGMKEIKNGCLNFEWNPDEPIEDEQQNEEERAEDEDTVGEHFEEIEHLLNEEEIHEQLERLEQGPEVEDEVDKREDRDEPEREDEGRVISSDESTSESSNSNPDSDNADSSGSDDDGDDQFKTRSDTEIRSASENRSASDNGESEQEGRDRVEWEEVSDGDEDEIESDTSSDETEERTEEMNSQNIGGYSMRARSGGRVVFGSSMLQTVLLEAINETWR